MADEHGLGSQTASEEARASGDAGSVERDPAGLLQRVPELLPLAGRSPQLKRAIEEGRPHAAYRALIWLKLRGAGTDGPLVNTLLARRRLFLQPLKGAPWMVTYNGVGASVYGATELDPQDRTSVKTHYLVFVFLPFFPLGAYLTRPAEQGKGWTFFGKVPLSLPLYLWQRGVALIVLLLVLGGALSAVAAARYNTVHVANGFPFPVQVKIGSAEAVVMAGSVGKVRASVGTQPIEVRRDGVVIDHGSVDVPRGFDAVVYNVLGAAPVYLETVTYTADSHDRPEESGELFCGRKSFAFDHVDYAFSDPPGQLSMPKDSKQVQKKHMGILSAEPAKCAKYLEKIGQTAGAGELRDALAKLHVQSE
ncbi:MAG TPA: hypothetical protein VGR66_06460 [Candidatus Eisenbacteria bacterium]|jgi:hypothetical protein|nr:hypothetical protein [Candidatus Eisenbacteria bacterium]